MPGSAGQTRAVLSADTSPDAERIQIGIWRAMSGAERADLIRSLTSAVRALAFAGLRDRHPGAGERELFLRYAALTLGADLARRVHADFDDILQPPT